MERIKISQSLYNHLQACGAKKNTLDMYEVDSSKKTPPITSSKRFMPCEESAPWDKL